MKHILKILIPSILLIAALIAALVTCTASGGGGSSAKPVIYLYPEQPCDAKPVVNLYAEAGTLVNVTLDYAGELTCTYPAYENGWQVIAHPDGTLTDPETGHEYSYLFWEGVDDVDYDLSRGFVVPGEDTADFLRETLAYLGLTAREYNEFIVYWLPQMEGSAYNLITFQTDAYTENARLTIDPQPDSLLRVFMVWKPLEEYVAVEPQALEGGFQREGFTVVEWGGRKVE